MSLSVRVRRQLPGFTLDMDLTAGEGILGILGASGSGKSMTLRCVAGIDRPDEGRIELCGRTLLDSARGINLRPQVRRVGYLFQSYALFPHMTVLDNIRAALPGKRGQARAGELIERFRLDGLAQRYPGQLSGGQQQRVALARCLAAEPDALLLDEPFSALDIMLKEQMQLELRDMLSGYQGPVVLVTHDQAEAYQMTSRLAVLDGGRCVAQGETQGLFREPGHVRVAELTGCRNISPAKRTAENRVLALDWGIELTAAGPVPPDISAVGIREGALSPCGGGNRFSARVTERLSGIDFALARALPEGGTRPLWVRLANDADHTEALCVSPQDVLLLRGRV